MQIIGLICLIIVFSGLIHSIILNTKLFTDDDFIQQKSRPQ